MVTSAAVYQLKSRFRGELILPRDPGYDTARAVFNAAIDRRPALIARCVGRDDVIAGGKFRSRAEAARCRARHRAQRRRFRRLR